MGVSKVALLALLAVGAVVSSHAELEEEDPFDFDAEDEGAELDESDSGYGQKPLTKVRFPLLVLLSLPCLALPCLALPPDQGQRRLSLYPRLPLPWQSESGYG